MTKRKANFDKEKAKSKAALDAMNNVKPTVSATNQKNKEKTESKSIAPVGISRANMKGMKKRKKRYDDRVWKGWRESDGVSSPVLNYNLKDLE